jgi:5'-deoxynucleotidase YfbR-like HD superfamily hydrolase
MSNTERPEPTLFKLQELVVGLAMVERNHHLIGQDRTENDIEHSFAVAMLAWYICQKLQLSLNVEKILKYALVHDFVERYAGDVNTFASDKARDDKAKLEEAALSRLGQEFAEFEDLVRYMNDYETKTDEESLFVWTVDKLQALVLGELDDWRPYVKVDVSYDNFVTKHSEFLTSGSPYVRKMYKTMMEYFVTTYYDRPGARKK